MIADLTASNIVFELPDIQSMSPARVSQLLGPVKTENLRLTNGLCSPHAPKQVIQTPDLSGLDCSLLTQIRIIDFGQAFFTDRPPPSLGVPIDFSPQNSALGIYPQLKVIFGSSHAFSTRFTQRRSYFPQFFRYLRS